MTIQGNSTPNFNSHPISSTLQVPNQKGASVLTGRFFFKNHLEKSVKNKQFVTTYVRAQRYTNQSFAVIHNHYVLHIRQQPALNQKSTAHSQCKSKLTLQEQWKLSHNRKEKLDSILFPVKSTIQAITPINSHKFLMGLRFFFCTSSHQLLYRNKKIFYFLCQHLHTDHILR